MNFKLILCIAFLAVVSTFASESAESIEQQVDPAITQMILSDLQKFAQDKTSLSCASTTEAGDVYIMNTDKDYMFCGVYSTFIGKVNTIYGTGVQACTWRMTYCTADTQAVYQLFSHYDSSNNLVYLFCYNAGGVATCVQTQITGATTDYGQFFRFDTQSTGYNLYNTYNSLTVRDDGSQLQLGGTASVFRVCFTNVNLAYC